VGADKPGSTGYQYFRFPYHNQVFASQFPGRLPYNVSKRVGEGDLLQGLTDLIPVPACLLPPLFPGQDSRGIKIMDN
jgi:hypothetical protein